MKKELIEKIMSLTHPTQDIAYVGKGFLQQILEEELPDFQRIDWERLRDCFEKASNGYVSSHLHVAVKEYNSTLPPALVPLPKDMPKYFFRQHSANDADDLWEWLLEHYGTPANNLQPLPDVDTLDEAIFNIWGKFMTDKQKIRGIASFISKTYGTPETKPELPSVEELARELNRVYWGSDKGMTSLAQHLHDKYSLPTREWWQDCEKFMYKGRAYKKYSHEVFPDGRTVLHSELAGHNLIYCTPYTPPSAQDIIAKHNLSEEEVKILREGKCT